jgi:hypothetical protein
MHRSNSNKNAAAATMFLAVLVFFIVAIISVVHGETINSNKNYLVTKNDKLIRGLYLGWLGKYNEGDEAMYHIAAELFANIGINMGMSVSLFPYKPPLTCHLAHITLKSYDFIVHGGGSVLGAPEYQCILRDGSQLQIPVVAFGTGWKANDATGGKQIIEQFHNNDELKRHNKTETSGFNILIAQDVGSQLNVSLKSYQYGGYRGIFTKTVADLMYSKHGLDVIGDSGILAKRLMHSYYDGTLHDTNNNKNDNSIQQPWDSVNNNLPIVAINYGANNPDPTIFHSNADSLFASFVDVGASLAKYGYNVFYYAMSADDLEHVERVYVQTVEVLNRVREQKSGEASQGDLNVLDRVHMLEYLPDTIHILQLLSASKFSINYKLHGNVLSAAVNTPFISISYHLKSIEFSRFIDLSIEEKYSIRTDFIQSADDFEEALQNLHADGEMERYQQLLKDKIETTDLKYNSMILELLKDILLRRLEGR